MEDPTIQMLRELIARVRAMEERLGNPVNETGKGRPIKLKPGRPVILTPELMDDGRPAAVIVTPESSDGGQAARVQGARVRYQQTAKA